MIIKIQAVVSVAHMSLPYLTCQNKGNWSYDINILSLIFVHNSQLNILRSWSIADRDSSAGKSELIFMLILSNLWKRGIKVVSSIYDYIDASILNENEG